MKIKNLKPKKKETKSNQEENDQPKTRPICA